jgi:nucleoside-diphosphate-sugar epimerase
MKALVTGGGGFLGGAIVRQLLERGDSVRSFSRGYYPELDKLGAEQMQGDLADLNAVKKAVDGCGIVFHVGAKAGHWGHFREYYNANVLGTSNVLHACEATGVDRLVYTSSPSVVLSGKDMEGVDESVPYPDRYVSPYPETKSIAEKTVLAANSGRLATVALRPHLIFGPGDPHLVPRILAKAKSGRLRIIGKGDNKMDIVYVDNAARAHILAADNLVPGSSIAGKAYFISNGDPRSVKDLFNMIMETHGMPPVKRKVPPWLAYFGGWLFEKLYVLFGISEEPLVTRLVAKELSTSHWFDISSAMNDFGYVPEVSVDEGFRQLRLAHLQAAPAA